MSHESRERTYSYHLPMTPAARAELKGLSGMEVMGRISRGELPAPPIAATMNMDIAKVEKGFAVFEAEAGEWAENPLGTVHGGWVSTLLDSALGCAVHSCLEAGQGYTTATLEVKFVRAIYGKTGRLRAEGRVLHVGGKLAVAEAKLVGVADGKLYATATTTCVILEQR